MLPGLLMGRVFAEKVRFWPPGLLFLVHVPVEFRLPGLPVERTPEARD
jgi:hypothetical protein